LLVTVHDRYAAVHDKKALRQGKCVIIHTEDRRKEVNEDADGLLQPMRQVGQHESRELLPLRRAFGG
jgi:hypothetical protein